MAPGCRCVISWRIFSYSSGHPTKENAMGKGMDRKKEEKKKPAKTLEEKRAAKRAKKEGRG
jgi:hypothetical protein